MINTVDWNEHDQQIINWYGMLHCPAESCGVHLDNGVGETGQGYNHEKYQFVCLGCCTEFGPEVKKAPVKTGKAHSKDMSLRAKVLEFLDEQGSDMSTAARVKLVASVFDITPANARYYVSRVWRKV